MEAKNIKNIIFDLGGVILNIDYNKTARAFKEIGGTNFDTLYSQFRQNNLFDDLETGNIKPRRFIQELKSALPLRVSDNQIINAWNAMLLDLPKERVDLLKSVGKQYQIFLLSNTNKIHYDAYMAYFNSTYRLNFNSLFEKAYYSHEIGLRKPNNDCFEFVLKSHSLNTTETLFIDDSIQHIESAKRLGIKTYHHTEGCITKLFSAEGDLLNLLA
jgi:putative hydrolase of the HAD superfamily